MKKALLFFAIVLLSGCEAEEILTCGQLKKSIYKQYDMAISQLGTTQEALDLKEHLIKERNRMLKKKVKECLTAEELADME